VETFSAYVPKVLPKHEQFLSGRRSCKGCGKALTARIVSKTLGHICPRFAPHAGGPSAGLTGSHGFARNNSLNDDLIEESLRCFDALLTENHAQSNGQHTPQPKPVVAVSRRALDSDGTALARALQRRPDILILCLDNEPSIDALIRRAIPQPFQLNERRPVADEAAVATVMRTKNMPPQALANAFSYRATACVSHPFDLIDKLNKGLSTNGSAFILALTPCPTGWMFSPRQTLAVAAGAVRSGWFPLYEEHNGVVSPTMTPRKRIPVAQFLAMQQRFFTLPKTLLPCFQREVDTYTTNLDKAKRADGFTT
jgi:pyruvate ferredoxin oxidoreductase beta subunit